jgi:hypothetical protein
VFLQFGGVRVCDMTRAGAEPTSLHRPADRGRPRNCQALIFGLVQSMGWLGAAHPAHPGAVIVAQPA